jgi:hypothetical protein
MDIILDHPDDHNVITRVHKSEQEARKFSQNNVMAEGLEWTLLKMEEGTMCQEEQMGKDKEMDSL